VSRVSATERFDVIIVGSGAGGGTMAHALAPTGARILLVERGEAVPREAENWDPAAVWRDLRYRTRETWVDREGAEFLPYTHYCVGGNTKFWGSVLIRLRREDFGVLRHVDGESPAWPIDYETLAPYYDRAEVLRSHRAVARALSACAGAACADDAGHRGRPAGAGAAAVPSAARPARSGH
jgi:choline dehydrogenase-like flavoprotein